MDKELLNYLYDHLRELNLKELRCFIFSEMGLSPEDLAQRENVSLRTVSRYRKTANDKIYHIKNHDEIIAALQELFFCDK
jgi:DNA-binding CsgD family transcriptional regulator